MNHTQLFFIGAFVGFFLILTACILVDRLGTYLYSRGFAKPFYLLGKRIHHAPCIYFLVPSFYVLLLACDLLGIVQFIWAQFWYRLAWTGVVVILSMVVDVLGDKYWQRLAMQKHIFRHEWIYLSIPVYVFLNVVKILI
jgi:hypothetical protein